MQLMPHRSNGIVVLLINLWLVSSSAFVLVNHHGITSPCLPFAGGAPPFLQSGDGRHVPNNRLDVSLSVKSRRRRKDAQPEVSPSTDDDEDSFNDLPDFELQDEPAREVKETRKEYKKAVTLRSPTEGSTSRTIIGSTSPGLDRSISELIADRSLEKAFQFDDVPESEALPDLAELARQRSLSEGGSKRERQEARRAAAQARDQKEQQQTQSIPNIPILTDFVTNAQGEVQFNKVLEAVAWMGIFLLVGWEIYINSPFFERSAPLSPIVF